MLIADPRAQRSRLMKRRDFTLGAISLGANAMLPNDAFAATSAKWRSTWDAALAALAANARLAPQYDQPVLFEGAVYRGTWQECGPHESLLYAQLAEYAPDGALSPIHVAKNTHRAFFAHQRADGQLPANLKLSGMDWAMVQMVVPIAATAWELAQLTGDEALLAEAYAACGRWDAWLRRYRDTRGTGLVEAFCTWDTGQDHSPRWSGVSDGCPDGDPKRCPEGQSVPRLCPDLSATIFGARVALSAMANALGKPAEAQKWRDDAERMRARIIDTLWCEEDASFYDVGPDGAFVRVRSVANMRVLSEHVLRLSEPREKWMFDALWERQLHNPRAYWTRYPFPSIAADDPVFVRPIPRNSWGGASQALTAMRTLRWMDHYGKHRAQRQITQRWCEAIIRANGFHQQMAPETGVFTQPDPGGYSPAALTFLHFAKRLNRAPH